MLYTIHDVFSRNVCKMLLPQCEVHSPWSRQHVLGDSSFQNVSLVIVEIVGSCIVCQSFPKTRWLSSVFFFLSLPPSFPSCCKRSHFHRTLGRMKWRGDQVQELNIEQLSPRSMEMLLIAMTHFTPHSICSLITQYTHTLRVSKTHTLSYTHQCRYTHPYTQAHKPGIWLAFQMITILKSLLECQSHTLTYYRLFCVEWNYCRLKFWSGLWKRMTFTINLKEVLSQDKM